MQITRFMMVAAVAMAGACVDSLEPEVGVVAVALDGEGDGSGDGEPSPGVTECPDNTCGGNSPVIDGVFFWRLHLGGEVSPKGLQVLSIHRADGTLMGLKLTGDGDRLFGFDLTTGARIAEHAALIGTTIEVQIASGRRYMIVINAVEETGEQFWVGAQLPIETYRFRYYAVPDDPSKTPQPTPLCPETDGVSSMIDALVFGGDLYDPDSEDVISTSLANGWINIACKSSALYKMHRIGYTTAARARLGIVTSLAQRRAMLNAWTGYMCGQTFTQQGEPITLSESLGLFNQAPYNQAPTSIEAIWNETGAVCLDVPRLADKDPDIYSKISDACGGSLPRPCATLPGDWRSHGYVQTGNP